MCDPVEDHVAVFDRKNLPPRALAQAIGTPLAGQRGNAWVPVIQRGSDALQPFEEAPCFGAWQAGKLLHDLRRDDQSHGRCSLIASVENSVEE